MTTATEIIERLAARGVTFQVESAGGLRVIGISRLSEQERETLKRRKTALLRALEPLPTVPTATTSSEPVAPATVATEPFPAQTEPAPLVGYEVGQRLLYRWVCATCSAAGNRIL